MGLRERKKEWTRRAVEETALELFEEKGFDETSVSEIAAAADVSPRTVFRYFPTKLDLVLGRFSEDLEHLLETLSARPATEDVYEALDATLVAQAAYLDHPDVVRRAAIARDNPRLASRGLELREEAAQRIAEELARRSGARELGPGFYVVGIGAVAVLSVGVATWIERGATPGKLGGIVEEVESQLPRIAAGRAVAA
jgi:AcrR family transcriptional regulator